jgi:hypothetical protein
VNRAETERLLRRRRDLTGESFNDGTVDAWASVLADVDYGLAVVALERAAPNGRVTIASLFQHLTHHTPRSRSHTDPIGAGGCRECGGVGFRVVEVDTDAWGQNVDRYGPCRTCRP